MKEQISTSFWCAAHKNWSKYAMLGSHFSGQEKKVRKFSPLWETLISILGRFPKFSFPTERAIILVEKYFVQKKFLWNSLALLLRKHLNFRQSDILSCRNVLKISLWNYKQLKYYYQVVATSCLHIIPSNSPNWSGYF